MSVIDAALRFPQCHPMLTADQIVAEMIRRLEKRTLAASDVAAHLDIARPRVTEMKTGKRRLQQHEMKPLAELLGMTDEVEPEQESAQVISIWSRIPEARRPQALDILETFTSKKG